MNCNCRKWFTILKKFLSNEFEGKTWQISLRKCARELRFLSRCKHWKREKECIISKITSFEVGIITFVEIFIRLNGSLRYHLVELWNTEKHPISFDTFNLPSPSFKNSIVDSNVRILVPYSPRFPQRIVQVKFRYIGRLPMTENRGRCSAQ